MTSSILLFSFIGSKISNTFLSFQYSVWNFVWLGWNAFLICYYFDIGILDRVRTSFVVSLSEFIQRIESTFALIWKPSYPHFRFEDEWKNLHENSTASLFGALKWKVETCISPCVMQLCFPLFFYFYVRQLRIFRNQTRSRLSSVTTRLASTKDFTTIVRLSRWKSMTWNSEQMFLETIIS